MMTKLFRLGKDAEVRSTPGGVLVTELALAYNYGKKGDDGKRPTQWIRAALWGERGPALSPYLKKGDQIVATLDDLYIKTREHDGKTYTDLVGRVVDVSLVSGGQRAESKPAPKPAAGDDFEDSADIPF